MHVGAVCIAAGRGVTPQSREGGGWECGEVALACVRVQHCPAWPAGP